MNEQAIGCWKKWMMAARPKTLPAAAAPVVLGTSLAYWDRVFQAGPALAALLGAFWLQIGSNLANDVFDFQRGADQEERLGPTRVTQTGLLSPRQVLLGMWVSFGAAALCGLYLTWAAGWPVIVIGLTSIAAALAYSGGPFPFGYHGLGDVFVILFFGVAAVGGTYFVQADKITLNGIAMGFVMGLLIDNILVVNNLRDIPLDSKAGKNTLAVLIGAKATRLQYLANLLAAFLAPVFLWGMGKLPLGVMLIAGTLPWGVMLIGQIWHLKGRELNKTLAATGQFALGYALLFALGGTLI